MNEPKGQRTEGRKGGRKGGRAEGRTAPRASGETVRLNADVPHALYVRVVTIAAQQRMDRGELLLRLIEQGLARYDLDAVLRTAMGQDEAAA